MEDEEYFQKIEEAKKRELRGYKVEENKLMRKRGEVWKEVVPAFKRNLLLNLYHNDPKAGHFGVSKTMEKIKENYEWPKLEQDVRRWIQQCETCQLNSKEKL